MKISDILGRLDREVFPDDIRLSSALWRSRRHGSSHVRLLDIPFHLPRHLIKQTPCSSILVLPKQIGIAISPLSNNAIFLTYQRSPLPDFFKAGRNVSLSTADPVPLQFTEACRFTPAVENQKLMPDFFVLQEPLLEEYNVAAHILKLSQSLLIAMRACAQFCDTKRL